MLVHSPLRRRQLTLNGTHLPAMELGDGLVHAGDVAHDALELKARSGPLRLLPRAGPSAGPRAGGVRHHVPDLASRRHGVLQRIAQNLVPLVPGLDEQVQGLDVDVVYVEEALHRAASAPEHPSVLRCLRMFAHLSTQAAASSRCPHHHEALLLNPRHCRREQLHRAVSSSSSMRALGQPTKGRGRAAVSRTTTNA